MGTSLNTAQEEHDFVDAAGLQDIWVDGIARIEVMEAAARVIYFKWTLSGGIWRKAPIDFAMVRPVASLYFGPKAAAPWPIMERRAGGMH